MSTSLASAITTFSGEDNGQSITYFIKNLADLALIEGWSEQKKTWMLRNKLVGKAANYVNNNTSLVNENDFETLCNKLIEHFTTSQSPQELQAEFSNLIHHPKETIQHLADRITSVVKRYIPNPRNSLDLENVRETVKLQRFIKTIRPDIKSELLKFGPDNFLDAINRAKNIKMALNDQALTLNNVSNQQSSSDILQRIERMEENFSKISESLSSLNNVTCHICGKNHLTTKCWNFP